MRSAVTRASCRCDNAGYWNDLHNRSDYTGGGLDVKGYYIEFSGYNKTGDTANESVPLVTAHTATVTVGGQTYYLTMRTMRLRSLHRTAMLRSA